jgi:hypothetical protein
MPKLHLRALAAPLTIAAATACGNAGSGLGPDPDATNAVTVQVYLDRDGSHTATVPTDTLFRNARVALLPRLGNDTFRVELTNAVGIARFDEVPLGEYRVGVTQASIGDSIEVQAIDSAEIRIQAADTNTFVRVRLGYPEFSVRAVRELPPGRRVFVRGIILAGVQAFRDTTSHLSDSSGFIRLTRVGLSGGLVGNSPGDSVSVLGFTSTRAGQPTLDQAFIRRFGSRPPPIPIPIATGTAATAQGGTLDAALTLITSAIIQDTATIAPDFRVRVNDGSGVLDIILDGIIPFSRSSFAPDRSLNAHGVLVPNGVGGWSFKPRSVGDVVLN